MIHLTPALSRAVQRRIDELETGGVGAWVRRHCKEALNALPLAGNQVYVWALRPDGTVLCVDHESFSVSAEEERDPVAIHAVAVHAARRYPELREMVPERPAGVEPCGACGETGIEPGTGGGCLACSGLGWRAMPRPTPAPDPPVTTGSAARSTTTMMDGGVERRPVDEWLARIDRGDHLVLQHSPGIQGLVAGRMAGVYVVRRPGEAQPWSAPADAAAREHVRALVEGYEPGRRVFATWNANVTAVDDPFESAGHLLRFYRSDGRGTYEVELARRPDGRYRLTVTENNDADCTWAREPTVSTREIDEAEARRRVQAELLRPESWSPFPLVAPRDDGKAE